MSKYYPDISHHHTVADWKEVEKNCPFLITKATQGTSFVDSAMEGIVRQCEKEESLTGFMLISTRGTNWRRRDFW